MEKERNKEKGGKLEKERKLEKEEGKGKKRVRNRNNLLWKKILEVICVIIK